MNVQAVLQTIDHRYRLTPCGLIITDVAEESDAPDADLTDRPRLFFSPAEALALADFVQANRQALAVRQAEMEQVWVAAANAVIDVIEFDRAAALDDLSTSTIYKVLEELSRVRPPSPIGRWYRSLWEGDAEVFNLQWGSFMRVWRRQTHKRRPDLFWRDIVDAYIPRSAMPSSGRSAGASNRRRLRTSGGCWCNGSSAMPGRVITAPASGAA